jgi:aryl carrier-like protein
MVPVISVDWDPYQWGSWLAAGLGGTPGFAAGLGESLERFGVEPARSFEALGRLLASDLPRVVVSAQDLAAVVAQTDAIHAAEMLAEMARGQGAKGAGRHDESSYLAPRTSTERALAGIWQELFGIERIGVDEDFLVLGGHSLLAIQLLTQVRNLLGADLEVPTLFEHPTIAGLARVIDAGSAAEEPGKEELEDLLAQVEGLSPEEVARLLAEERQAEVGR